MKNEYRFSDIKKHLETTEMLKSSINKKKETTFYGFESFGELTKEVGKPFLRPFSNLESSINPAMIKNDICGFAPNIPKFLNGEPECMYNFETKENTNYHELNFYISMSWSVNASEIKKNGLILAKYLQENTSPKDKFKITFHSMSYDIYKVGTGRKVKDSKLDLSIVVSDFNDYLTDNLLNLICSPAFYRLYILNAQSYAYGRKKRELNAYPASFAKCKIKYPDLELMNFMDLSNELKEIKR